VGHRVRSHCSPWSTREHTSGVPAAVWPRFTYRTRRTRRLGFSSLSMDGVEGTPIGRGHPWSCVKRSAACLLLGVVVQGGRHARQRRFLKTPRALHDDGAEALGDGEHPHGGVMAQRAGCFCRSSHDGEPSEPEHRRSSNRSAPMRMWLGLRHLRHDGSGQLCPRCGGTRSTSMVIRGDGVIGSGSASERCAGTGCPAGLTYHEFMAVHWPRPTSGHRRSARYTGWRRLYDPAQQVDAQAV
jgi:hypothetical protein